MDVERAEFQILFRFFSFTSEYCYMTLLTPLQKTPAIKGQRTRVLSSLVQLPDILPVLSVDAF